MTLCCGVRRKKYIMSLTKQFSLSVLCIYPDGATYILMIRLWWYRQTKHTLTVRFQTRPDGGCFALWSPFHASSCQCCSEYHTPGCCQGNQLWLLQVAVCLNHLRIQVLSGGVVSLSKSSHWCWWWLSCGYQPQRGDIFSCTKTGTFSCFISAAAPVEQRVFLRFGFFT